MMVHLTLGQVLQRVVWAWVEGRYQDEGQRP